MCSSSKAKKKKRKCICQLCICGRHHCDRKLEQRIPFAREKVEVVEEGSKTADAGAKIITEHKDRYRYFGFQEKVEPILPAGGADWRGTEDTIKESITKRDYVPFGVQKKASSSKLQKEYSAPKGKMSSSTTYKKDFQAKQAERRAKFKPIEMSNITTTTALPGSGDKSGKGGRREKMETETTYGRTYTEKKTSRREPAKAKECTLTEFGLPFTGNSETAYAYQELPYCKREQVKAKRGVLKTEGEFEGQTTHKTDYTAKFQPPPKPFKRENANVSRWKASTAQDGSDVGDGSGGAKFECETTHTRDFRCPTQSGKREMKIPKGTLMKFEGTFQGISNYKKDYPAHEIGKRQLPKWHPSRRSDDKAARDRAKMSGETTYRTDFEAYPDEQYERDEQDGRTTTVKKTVRHNLTLPRGDVPMEKLTTHLRDYRRVGTPAVAQSFKPQSQYVKPEGEFATCTTTGCDYTAKSVADSRAKKSAKQQDNIGLNEGVMQETTTHTTDYRWACLDCPAKYLKKYGKDALPDYRFDGRQKGHDYFKKLDRPKESGNGEEVTGDSAERSRNVETVEVSHESVGECTCNE